MDRLAVALLDAVRCADGNRVVSLLHARSEAERRDLRRALVEPLRARMQAALRDPGTLWTQAVDLTGTLGTFIARAHQLVVGGRERPDSRMRLQEFIPARLLLVGIGNQTDVKWALFNSRLPGDWSFTERRPEEDFWFRAGTALIDRPEPWSRDLLVRILEHDAQWSPSDAPRVALGLRLIRDGVLTLEQVEGPLARVARRDGFRNLDLETELGRRILFAALEREEDPPLSSVDFPGGLSERLLALVTTGRMQRRELLALAVRRLGAVSRPAEANWWAGFMDRLAPTDADWREESTGVLDLLAAPTPRAVGLAVTLARRLLAASAVEPAELVPLLSTAVSGPNATSARNAVSLLQRCAAQDPAVADAAFEAALAGLAHPKPAVRDAVLAWLEKDPSWKQQPELVLTATAMVDSLAPPTAARLERLLPDEARLPPAPATAEPGRREPDLRVRLLERLERESDAARRAWLEACSAALDGTGPLPEPWTRIEERWRSDPPFELPQSPEETARLMLRATVEPLDGAARERVYAGVRAPLSEAQRASLRRLLDPVLRARERLSGDMAPFVGFDSNLLPLCRLAELWLGSAATAEPAVAAGLTFEFPAAQAARKRFAAAQAARERGDASLPLCTPTRAAGWLDAEVFAGRLAGRAAVTCDEYWELATALYRLAPDPAARAAAWERIEPVAAGFPVPASLALAAALAPPERGDAAAEALAAWIAARTRPVTAVETVVRNVDRALQQLLAARPSLLPPREEDDWIRLLAAALRCRHGLGAAPPLGRVVDRLPVSSSPLPFKVPPALGDLRSLLVHPRPFTGELLAELRNEPSGYFHLVYSPETARLVGTFPELAPYSLSSVGLEFDAIALEFPAGAERLVESAVRRKPERYNEAFLAAALRLACRRDVRLRPLVLPLLETLAISAPQVRGAAAELLGAGLEDGRLRCCDVIEAFGESLRRREGKPRALLGALEHLAGRAPELREAAALAAERAVALGSDDLTPAERVALLEALLGWRSAAGRTLASGEAGDALRALAAPGKSSRAAGLARQLLALSPAESRQPSSRQACVEYDVRVLVSSESEE